MRLPCAVVWDWFHCSSRRLVVVYPSMDFPSDSCGVKQILLIHLHLSRPFLQEVQNDDTAAWLMMWWEFPDRARSKKAEWKHAVNGGRGVVWTGIFVILTASLLFLSQYSLFGYLEWEGYFSVGSWHLNRKLCNTPHFHAQYPASLNTAQHDYVIDEIFYLTAWGKSIRHVVLCCQLWLDDCLF